MLEILPIKITHDKEICKLSLSLLKNMFGFNKIVMRLNTQNCLI